MAKGANVTKGTKETNVVNVTNGTNATKGTKVFEMNVIRESCPSERRLFLEEVVHFTYLMLRNWLEITTRERVS